MDAPTFRFTKLALAASLLVFGPAAAQAQTDAFVFPNGNAVTLLGQSGASLPVTSQSGNSIAFNTSTVYASGDRPWLNVNNLPSFSGSTGTGGITLYFQLGQQAGLLTAGTHTATVNLAASDSSGAAGSITVTYDTNSSPTGGGSGGITASPSPLNVTAQSGQSNVPLQLITSNSTPITFSVQQPAVSWLTVSPTSGQVVSGTPTNLTVTLNPYGLPATNSTTILINYSGTTLQVPVNYTVGSGSGGSTSGSLTVNPSTVSWTFTTGGAAPGAQSISLSTTSTATLYNATVYSANNWLQLGYATNGTTALYGSPISGGLVFSPTQNIYSLPTGQYVGTISITAFDGSTATVTVNLSVNPSSNTGLTMSPNPININAQANGVAVTQQVIVTSSLGGSISATISPANSGLSVLSIGSGTIPAGGSVTITLQGNPAGLSPTVITGQLTVQVNGSTINQLSDQINFTIGNPNSGGGGTTSATALFPSTLNFAYQTGSTMPTTLTQEVYLSGTDTFTVSYPAGQTWITVNPASGVAPGLLNVSVKLSGLSTGTNTGTVTFTGASGSTTTLTVSLLVTSSPVTYSGGAYGDIYIPFVVGSSAASQQTSLFIYASDNSNTAVSASVANPTSTPWLSVAAGSSSPTTPATFTVTATPTNLANGLYQGAITITSGAANNPQTVPIILSVSGGVTSGGSLTLSSSSITFPQVQANGATPAPISLQVGAANPTSFSITTTTNNNSGNWLNVSPAGVTTTPATLTISANQGGLAVGTYTGQISLTANGVTQTVGVTLVVGSTAASGSVTVTANNGNGTPSLSFSSQGGATPASQFLTVNSASGAAAVPFTVAVTTADGSNWLQTGAVAGVQVQTPYNLTVNISPAALAPGNYSGTITISPTGGNPVSIPVSLTVTGSPQVTVSATPLTFSFQAGQGAPPSQTVQVTATNAGSVQFTATASSAGWLSVTPTSGTAPATITVSVSPGSLSAGTYVGNIVVAGANGAGGNTTISVTLTVTAPLPTINAVVNVATSQAGPIAPGEIIAIYGTYMGPSTGVTLQLANGKVSTSIGGVQVYVGGYAAPLIYVSAGQINASVPYEAANLLNPTVLVQYLGQSSNGFNLNRAVSNPGIFTANQSGTGPGAILNGDNSYNSPSNPAARGSVVQVYMTGEGATSPGGVTGGVTAVTSTGLPVPVLPVAVLVNNEPSTATFVGEAPGLISGVLQVNVQIPTDIPVSSGVANVSLVISVGGNQSQAGVTLAVK